MIFFDQNKRFDIYFGGAKNSISLQEMSQQKKTPSLQTIAQQLHIDQLVFLHQNHGVDGFHLQSNDDQSYYFTSSGDYIWTQKTDCGIGVVTADCLPIVLYDPITHTASVIHAGWKGLVADIFTICLKNILHKTKAQIHNIQIYLGPAARPCCYEVQQDFINQFQNLIEMNGNTSSFFIQRNNKIYFDSRIFIAIIARNLGIKQENLYTRYNVCTICDVSFCSYRREKEKAQRQVTIICLR